MVESRPAVSATEVVTAAVVTCFLDLTTRERSIVSSLVYVSMPMVKQALAEVSREEANLIIKPIESNLLIHSWLSLVAQKFLARSSSAFLSALLQSGLVFAYGL